MEKIIYDLHIHSALSPCGDNDMTVNNILNMAVLNGIQTLAITDHNSCKNCPAPRKNMGMYRHPAQPIPCPALPGIF